MWFNYILVPIIFVISLPTIIVSIVLGVVSLLIGILCNDRTKKLGADLLISIDQYVNVIFLGDPDETISSRLGKKILDGRADWFHKYVCKELDKVDKNHCLDSIEE